MVRDDAWFEQLYERHHRAVSAYCVRRVGHSEAPDAVGEVFAVAWRRVDDVPGDDRALPWLYGVARRVVSHHWRGARRGRRLVEKAGTVRVVPHPGPEVQTVANVEHQMVRDAAMQLRAIDREVLLLSAWEGLTHGQIAEALGCSLAAVDKRVTRAKNRLARRYESLAGVESPTSGQESPEIQFPQCAPRTEVRTREP
jgi:RNA polymerase sigma-70 factor (ECF subfamily)